mmetsp:Transcript_105325/g.307893  ORF Transcript_105325/g.307893 Transcript_105325/m.307893 type:complete len:302 (-) Transcript_105325:28-933(-)
MGSDGDAAAGVDTSWSSSQDGYFTIQIDRSSGGKLGVDIDDSNGVSLIIMRMKAGLIEDWNRRRGDAVVRVGDHVVEVNGICGDVDRMFEECTTASALVLKLQHVPSPEEFACPTDASEVLVHVYDLWGSRSRLPRLLNAGSTRFGVFHTGVEVYGREWYFCGTEDANAHGVYCMPEPKLHPVHRYTRSIQMGAAQLSREVLEELMPAIRQKWMGGTYDPWRRNCHHFTDFFCQILGFPSGPSFGLCGAGDRSLTQQGSEHRKCFPCSSSASLWRRHSAPLLSDETSGSVRCPELTQATAN